MPRQGGPVVEVIIHNSPSTGSPWCGWVVDRSTDGVCFTSPESIPVGMVLSIRATTAPETVPWAQVEVKHCLFKFGRWVVGGKFLESVPYDVLRLLGHR